MRELAIEIGVRALLFGVFVFTEFLDPFQRVIQPEEIWLYKNPLVQSDNIPTRLMFAISFLTPLAVICVVKIIRRTDKTEIKEAFLGCRSNSCSPECRHSSFPCFSVSARRVDHTASLLAFSSSLTSNLCRDCTARKPTQPGAWGILGSGAVERYLNSLRFMRDSERSASQACSQMAAPH